MYKPGGCADMAVNMAAGSANVTVANADAAMFPDGSLVTIFDRDHEQTGLRVNSHITGTANTVLTLDGNASALYVAGYSSAAPIGKGAAIALDIGDTHSPVKLAYAQQAFGGDTHGTDGGTFCEIVQLGTVKKCAYKQYLRNDTTPDYLEFKNAWFSSTVSPNKIALTVAHLWDNPLDLPAGYTCGNSLSAQNCAFVYRGNIDVHVPAAAVGKEEIALHEIGHNFDLAPPSPAHVDTSAAVDHSGGPNKCIMGGHGNTNPGDGIVEFCKDCIKDVRENADPL